jgi:CheY-like chemotaxis protein
MVRILIIEDNALIGMLLSMMLEGLGYEVCAVATTESEAIEAARQHVPDLMIVDDRLSDGSGMGAVDAICRLRLVPHFFVSGDIAGIKHRRPDAIAITKPYRVSDLQGAIDRALHATKIDLGEVTT